MAEESLQSHCHVLTTQIKHTLVPAKCHSIVMLQIASNSVNDLISGHGIVLRHFLKLCKPVFPRGLIRSGRWQIIGTFRLVDLSKQVLDNIFRLSTFRGGPTCCTGRERSLRALARGLDILDVRDHP